MEPTGKQFPKRNAILACLRQSDAHPSAEAVYRELHKASPDVSLATVYRNLSRFKKMGMISSVRAADGTERFDWNAAPHAHFLCSHCGAVLDLPGVELPAELAAQAEAQTGGRVCALCVTGLCKSCNQVETT